MTKKGRMSKKVQIDDNGRCVEAHLPSSPAVQGRRPQRVLGGTRTDSLGENQILSKTAKAESMLGERRGRI